MSPMDMNGLHWQTGSKQTTRSEKGRHGTKCFKSNIKTFQHAKVEKCLKIFDRTAMVFTKIPKFKIDHKCRKRELIVTSIFTTKIHLKHFVKLTPEIQLMSGQIKNGHMSDLNRGDKVQLTLIRFKPNFKSITPTQAK